MPMLPSFCRTTVQVTRAPMVSRRGTVEPDWANAVTHVETGCDAQPAGSASSWTTVGQPVTVRLVLRLPPGADIRAGDRVTVDGTDYAIEGAPHAWRSPSGAVSHIEAQLVDWR